MLFEISGLVISALFTGIILIYKWSGDIGPSGLKRLLTRIALKNWQQQHPARFGLNNSQNPKTSEETGVVPSPEEEKLETPRYIQHSNETDELRFYGIDEIGNSLVARILKLHKNITEATLSLQINGVTLSVCKRSDVASPSEFGLGTFKFEMVEAMRVWRIWYNGPMKNEDNGKLSHVVLNFLWKPFDSPLDSRQNLNFNLLSDYFSQDENFGSKFFDFSISVPDGYSQFGTCHGTIRIDNQVEKVTLEANSNGNEEFEEIEVYLFGFRNRKWDSISSLQKFSPSHHHLSLELFGMSGTDGNAFRLSGFNGAWTDGHVHLPSARTFEIKSIDVPAKMFASQQIPSIFSISDSKQSFQIDIWPKFKSIRLFDLEIFTFKMSMNGKPGTGILLRSDSDKIELSEARNLSSSIIDTSLEDTFNFKVAKSGHLLKSEIADDDEEDAGAAIVSFLSKIGRSIAIVGGKGASLAQLAQLSRQSELKFSTAKGFSVTTTAFKSHLPLDEFRNAFTMVSSKTDLERTCEEVMTRIKLSNAKEKIRPLIEQWIAKTWPEDTDKNIKLAVRSSGLLEDGSELSSAGQNETFLGILPLDVPEKVVECWTSLFTSQSVQYRLNHGQPAVSEMAVVIQEMVPSVASAGVFFTADPRTGNPFKMMISANYGLGESVVSAACDPDTIQILRSKNFPYVQIGHKTLGSKKSKIVLNENGQTSSIDMGPEETSTFSISDEIGLDLGLIAVKIEKELGRLRPVDLEWAVTQAGEIYILQCRSITSLDSWTDFELIHEADSPYNSKFERLTHANTGEVLPGAVSPLTLSVVARLLDVGIQRRAIIRTSVPVQIVPHTLRKSVVSRQRFLLNVLNVFYTSLDVEIYPAQVASDMSIFGHRVIDDEIHALAIQRHGLDSTAKKTKELFALIKTIRDGQVITDDAVKLYSNYTISMTGDTGDVNEIYRVITAAMIDLYNISYTHCLTSEASTVTQMFAFLTLAQGRQVEAWDSELFQDVSKVLAVCLDVESADFPTAMDELSKTIEKYGGSTNEILENFVQAEPMVAYSWISTHAELIIRKSLDDFIEKHGHRCISELDLMKKSWKSNPIPFVSLLQSLVRNKIKYDGSKVSGPKVNQYSSDDALLASLHTPLGRIAKRFLKFLLPYCRRAVYNREKTKSLIVRVGDQFKKLYEKLGQAMTKNQLLPDPRLIFFMSHHEIGQLIHSHTASPKIIFKAMRKMKLYPELDKEEYPEITIGIRKPMDKTIKLQLGDGIKATPVSSGKVQAPVKVCRTIEEASELIEAGDILVTYGTDIGWSPFFPILGGIVTELGGLISHGAVVAREYGLPCIVGATGATKIFQTGDHAILDAGKGTLTKVKFDT